MGAKLFIGNVRAIHAEMKSIVGVAFALAVAVGAGYLVAVKNKPAPPPPPLPPLAELRAAMPPTTDPIGPNASTRPPDESISEPHLANEQRAAAIKKTMIEVMATWREPSANGLVERGLAPVDSAQLAQRFVEGAADCLLDAARKEYEAQEKRDGDEMSWTQIMAYTDLNRVQAAAVPCVTNISQQTGIPLPANFGSAGSHADSITPEPPPPPWAADMGARIREHVASHPEVAIASVIVNCVEQGCNVSLVGRDIRIFDLEFDVFAEQNGFQHAVLRGDRNLRFVWLQR